MARLLIRLNFSLFFLHCCFLANTVYGQGNGEFLHVLPAEASRLFIVQQYGDDVSIEVQIQDDELFVLDHPIGRTGPELFLIGPYPEEKSVVITVISSTGGNDYSVDFIDIESGSRMIPVLERFTEAGSVAADRDIEDHEQLVQIYGEVAQLGISEYGISDLSAFIQAQLLFDISRYDEALELLADHRSNPALVPFVYKTRLLEGELYFAKDDHSNARLALESALEVIDSLDLPASYVDLDKANLELTLGFARLLTGSMDEGKESLDSALEIGTRYMNPETLGKVHNNLGGYYSIISDYENSVRHFNLAIDNLRLIGETQELIYTLENLGLIYGWMGEYRLARETTHLALSLAEKRGVLSELSGAYTSIVSLYNKLGEYQVAEELSRMAMQLDLDSDREWRSATMMAIHADALIGQDKTAEAIERYLQALAFFKQEGSQTRIMTTYQRLIAAYLQAGELDQAKINLDVAKALGESFTTPGSEIFLERFDLMEAELALVGGMPSDTIRILEPLFEDDYELVQPDNLVMAELLMDAYRDEGGLDDAIAYGEIALNFIDRIREQLEFARLGPAWSQKTFPIYLKVVDNLMEQYSNSGDIEFAKKAFEASERGLAFNLAQQRFLSRKVDRFESETSKELRLELSILARQRAAQQGSENDELEIDYFRALEKYQASVGMEQIESLSISIPEIAEVQSEITPETLLVEFVCVPERNCYVFSLSSDDFEAVAIGAFSEIEILASAVQTEVRSTTARRMPASEKLGSVLFEGISRGGARNIKVVANYPINTVPIAALGIPGNQSEVESLVSNYRISNLPSVSSVLSFGEDENKSYNYELSVLADPEFSHGQTAQLDSVNLEATDSLRGWYDNLGRLPWSALEARSLESIYTDEAINIMTGVQASKSNLLDEGTRNSRIIHIASHGYFSTTTPDLVGIATSPQQGDTGFVSLEELMMYPFNAELVVISGCETGLGEQRGGEGMISLARGFLGQGVNHVISTLWPVSDRASAEFMKLFYQALHNQNQPVDEALQTAQVALSSQAGYSSPFFWAPYVLTSLGN